MKNIKLWGLYLCGDAYFAIVTKRRVNGSVSFDAMIFPFKDVYVHSSHQFQTTFYINETVLRHWRLISVPDSSTE